MAYLDHTGSFAGVAGAVTTPVDVAALVGGGDLPVGGFSSLEWTVIALARRDRLSSIAAPGWFARVMSRLFGVHRASSLADPRLETLRRVAVHAWHKGHRLSSAHTAAFLAAGFSTDQLETLLSSIVAEHPAAPRKAFA